MEFAPSINGWPADQRNPWRSQAGQTTELRLPPLDPQAAVIAEGRQVNGQAQLMGRERLHSLEPDTVLGCSVQGLLPELIIRGMSETDRLRCEGYLAHTFGVVLGPTKKKGS